MELADVLDSKSSPGDRVRVRPPPPAPKAQGGPIRTPLRFWRGFGAEPLAAFDLYKVLAYFDGRGSLPLLLAKRRRCRRGKPPSASAPRLRVVQTLAACVCARRAQHRFSRQRKHRFALLRKHHFYGHKTRLRHRRKRSCLRQTMCALHNDVTAVAVNAMLLC